MPKPTVLPRWADTVEADPTRVVTPTSGKQDVGWSAGERPPAQFLNWLALHTYYWVSWLDGGGGTQYGARHWPGVAMTVGDVVAGSTDGTSVLSGASAIATFSFETWQGSTIDRVAAVVDPDASASLTLVLLRKPTNGSAQSTVASVNSSGQDLQTLELTGLDEDTTGFSYSIRIVATSNTDSVVHSFTVETL